MEQLTGGDDVRALARLLDRIVFRSHHLRPFGIDYHPYLVCADASLLTVVVVSCVFSLVFGLELWRLLVMIAAAAAIFPLFLILKQRLLFIPTRVYLQDLLFFILPMGFLIARFLDIPLRALLDFAGIAVPLAHGVGRVGCFLGGCCFGKPSTLGVLYPRLVWDHIPRRRRFLPAPDPGRRVFPLQLLEAGFEFTVFLFLATRLALHPALRGDSLPMYLIAYAVFRFGAEFYRGDDWRKYYGPFSQAQWLSLLALIAGLLILIGLRT